MDEHQLLLPRSVRGLFINYGNHCYHRRSHFFARPAVAVDDGPTIDGKFSFIDPDKLSVVEFVDHCNGLILFFRPLDQAMYVCNPATQRWARLPPHPAGTLRRRALLVFDPAVSPHYTVMLAPDELTRDEAKGNHMEWPPSPWMWHEFSSRSGRWEEKVFVREGEAAGTVQGLLFDSFGYAFNPKWRYAAYWQGELYVDWRGEYVSRLSLLNKYQVIKTPIDLEERNKDVRSYLGRSENGVYFAAIDGFHPFKEVIFLCNKDSAVACHMNSSKVQYLGLIGLEGLYDSDERESFVYTPCLIGD
ncbi:hypothetical protein HU200_008071 [Digitaria exilis]|uniref:DUF295 domain-containing protein n=1 Tax=Digitaria exilis TaxID=1010633 RepID=A0A835KQM0_9POAL|nr:hypothetical protein HU200_008071 [Digitaria exilis]